MTQTKAVSARSTKTPATSAPANALIVQDDELSFEAHAGAGLEEVTSRDVLIPRLSILQGLSPQVNKRDSAYIEGAEVGMIADVGTGEIFPHGVSFLPVKFVKQFLEWAPRNTNKGLVNVHHNVAILDSCQRTEKGQYELPNKNYISETAQFFGFNLTANRRRCFVPMASSQLKKARKWMTLATELKLKRADGSEYNPALFYRTYNLSTAEETNAEGKWFGWVVTPGPTLKEIASELQFSSKAQFQDCLDFIAALDAGKVRGDATEEEMVQVLKSSGGEERM